MEGNTAKWISAVFFCQPSDNYLENEKLSKVFIFCQNFDVVPRDVLFFFPTDTPVPFPTENQVFSPQYSGSPADTAVSPSRLLTFDLTRLKQPLDLSCYLYNPSIVSGGTNLKQACVRRIRLIFDILEAAGMTSLKRNQIHGTDMFTRQMHKPLCITGRTTTANRQKPLWIKTTAEEEGAAASTSFPEPKERSRERGCSSLFHQIFVFAVPPDRCGGNFHCNLYCFQWWHDFKWIYDIVWLYSAWKWIQLNKLRLKPSKGNWGLTNWLSPSADIQDTNFRWHRTRDVRMTHSNVDCVTNAGKSLYDESCQTFDRGRLVFPVSLKSLTIYSKTYLINEQLVAKYHKEM